MKWGKTNNVFWWTRSTRRTPASSESREQFNSYQLELLANFFAVINRLEYLFDELLHSKLQNSMREPDNELSRTGDLRRLFNASISGARLSMNFFPVGLSKAFEAPVWNWGFFFIVEAMSMCVSKIKLTSGKRLTHLSVGYLAVEGCSLPRKIGFG